MKKIILLIIVLMIIVSCDNEIVILNEDNSGYQQIIIEKKLLNGSDGIKYRYEIANQSWLVSEIFWHSYIFTNENMSVGDTLIIGVKNKKELQK